MIYKKRTMSKGMKRFLKQREIQVAFDMKIIDAGRNTGMSVKILEEALKQKNK